MVYLKSRQLLVSMCGYCFWENCGPGNYSANHLIKSSNAHGGVLNVVERWLRVVAIDNFWSRVYYPFDVTDSRIFGNNKREFRGNNPQ